MGITAHRPEDPTEWAGLPSEPVRRTTPAEQLDAAIEDDGMGLVTGGDVSWVAVPLAPPADGSDASDRPGPPR
ncbi:hypothetical protein ACFQRL_06370 [Microbacterium fluvii]|uniref:Uncharacterized protein n=1 Tax=Microbacterium fluvii TaxID=415215 RepID=A0ABW2HFU0_9MICO|nr:hypothetical protein [Microbacterium fluvii]MCU4672209.1 hypothetical protein [Microbacterium fluvii]